MKACPRCVVSYGVMPQTYSVTRLPVGSSGSIRWVKVLKRRMLRDALLGLKLRQAEQSVRVACGQIGQFLEAQAAQLRHPPRHQRHVPRLVALATERRRRQVRAVRLD